MVVQDVWEHYLSQRKPDGKLYHYGAALGFKDEQLIKKQLKRFTAEQLKAAITQTHCTPWNIGEVNGKKYLGLRLCIGEEHLQTRLDAWHEEQQEQEAARDRQALQAKIERDEEQARKKAERFHAERLARGESFLNQVRNHNQNKREA